MTALNLPALDGRSPLGFLAALGVLHLITENSSPQTRLAWSEQDCTATLVGGHDHIDDLVTDLNGIVGSIPTGGVLPGVRPDFPPPGAAPDKMRLHRPQLREYASWVSEHTGTAGERWMASLVTDLSTDKDNRGDISLFTAPAGRQSMRTMLEKPLDALQKNPDLLREALRGWRRHPGVTGEYLDHRALFDAVDAPDGTARMRGVPGATWLALMSYPLLRTTAVQGEPLSTGWQPSAGPGSPRRLIYPLWSTPLDVAAVTALLQHPVLQGLYTGTPPTAARLLSIFLVCAAERRPTPGGKSAGVLTPIRIAPATSTRGGRARR
jgi:hypothetical protein